MVTLDEFHQCSNCGCGLGRKVTIFSSADCPPLCGACLQSWRPKAPEPPDDAAQWTAVENPFSGMLPRGCFHFHTSYAGDDGIVECFDCGAKVQR